MQPLPLRRRPLCRCLFRVFVRVRGGVGVGVILERPRQRNQVLPQQADPIRRGDEISEKPFFAGLSERQKAGFSISRFPAGKDTQIKPGCLRGSSAPALCRERCAAL